MDDFWRHNIAVGIAARIIATYHREPNVERFYLMGLLHDIGRLVMLIQIPNFMRKLLEESQQQPKLLYRSEFDLLGFDHAEVGRLLLKRWKLPATMEQVIGYHHHPNRATQFPVETAIVHFSDILINAMQLGFSGERYVPPLHDAAWQILKLPPALLTDIMDHIEQQYTDAVAIFLG